MAKLILVSVIFASVYFPLRAAADPDPRRGLRRTLWAMVLFNFAYLTGLMIFTPPLK